MALAHHLPLEAALHSRVGHAIANVVLKLLKCLADLLGAMVTVPLEIFHCSHHTDLFQLAPQAYANHP